jgi:hypothetical protein
MASWLRNGAGSEEVRLTTANGATTRVGSEGWCLTGERGEGTLGDNSAGAGPGALVGNAIFVVLGRLSRAGGLDTRSECDELRESVEADEDVRARGDGMQGLGLGVRREDSELRGPFGLASWVLGGREAGPEDDGRGGGFAAGGGVLGDAWGVAGRLPAMRFWYFCWKKEGEVGDMGGFGDAAGIDEEGLQTWSPSSAMGTGWLQVEHLTVGRIWDILPGSGRGAARVCAMAVGGRCSDVLGLAVCVGDVQRDDGGGRRERESEREGRVD